MAKIIPNQDFLDGKKRYKQGKKYEVEDNLAFYFGRMGWLTDVAGDAQPAEATLEVESANHGHEAGEL
jgi:hypothetical protein